MPRTEGEVLLSECTSGRCRRQVVGTIGAVSTFSRCPHCGGPVQRAVVILVQVDDGGTEDE